MKQECVDLISKTIGRNLTPAEGDNIVFNIKNKMGEIRRRDQKAWANMTRDDRIRAAGQEVAQDILDAAMRKKSNLLKQVLRQDERIRDLERLKAEEGIESYAAVAKIMQDTYRKARGIQNEYLTQMLDTLNGIKSKWLGFVEDAGDVEAFVREAFGENTGNKRAHDAWIAFSNTAEAMRQRAVRAGAEIGKLDYGYIPQSHDWWKVRKAGQAAWVDEIMPLLDRERFTDADGNAMSDTDLRALLEAAYNDIVTSGSPEGDITQIAANLPKIQAARYVKYPHRVLHFKDAQSFLSYEAKFGRGSLTGSLIGHVAKMSNDIALLESFGPKPQTTYNMMKGVAVNVANNAKLVETGWKLFWKYSDKHGFFLTNTDEIWNVLTGRASQIEVNSEGFAEIMAGWRNLEVAGKLGKAFISSFSDIPSYFVATGFNRLGFADGMKFFLAAYGSDWKDYATRAGFIADSIASDFCRWGSDNIGEGWTAKMAQATMKASFLNAFTDATRRAFCLNMMAGFAKMAKNGWNDLDAYDRARLQDGGITPDDWELIRSAGTETHNGIEFITIRQLQALQSNALANASQDVLDALPGKYLGFIINESEMASLGPDLITRAETTRGEQRGTIKGELARSFFLFKSFPIAMMERHFRRAAFLHRHGTMVDQVAYAAGIVVATSVFGALSVQLQNLLNGKDLQDMTSSKFWVNGLAKGGGLGFLGDYLANGLTEDARYGSMSGLTNFAGPIVGTTVDVFDLGTSMMGSAIFDKQTKPASRAVRIVRSHMPFVNMWYTSTVIDRAVMNELQDYLSPGYLRRMEAKQRRGTGQGYWWGLDEPLPDRAPKMAKQPNR